VRFYRLHGAGNDFLLFDGRTEPALEITLPPLVPTLCHRRLGLGADGVLLLLPHGEREARLLYWNADGSAARFCANGTRCAARLAAERWGWPSLVLHTGFAPVPAEVKGGEVTLTLPAPAAVGPWREFEAGGAVVRALVAELGVPHLIVPVEWADFWSRRLGPLAPELRLHPTLPAGGANVNFVRVIDGELAIRTWERGVEGETLACGSGSVASGLVASAEGWLAAPVAVRTASGRVLLVEPLGAPPACPSRLTGPAEWVAEGEVSPELLAGAAPH
jgi:diaminopimelate epimerase